MAANQPPGSLSKQASEKDFDRISQTIGSNWEMLAPYLLKENPTVTVEQIKDDHRLTRQRIRQLLLTWSQQTAPDATLGQLFYQMFQAGSSVNISWKSIAEKLNIDYEAVIACKHGYQHPVQESSADQTPETGRQNVADQLPIQVSSVERMEVDSLHVAHGEKMEVDEDQGDGRVLKDGNQTDHSSLFEKQKNKTYRAPIKACIFDGRLIKLEEDDINILDKKYIKKIGEGNFGKVYSTSDNSVHEGFGLRIAVKKMSLDGSDAHTRMVRREMIASRIMHPFVLPLLAVIDHPKGKPEAWFVSPLCENGDLFHAIKNGKIKKNKTKVKILLHIALAIQYIHTKVPKVRDVILHKDIASKNVLLDANFNARLIDFGLAREKDDSTATASGRIHYCHPHIGKGKGATESWDYFSFGVIIREMLTNLEPKGRDGYFLKDMRCNTVGESCNWLARSVAKTLNVIATDCLEKLEMNLQEFEDIAVQGIRDILQRDLNQDRIIDIPDDNTKCHICMINPKASKTSMTQEHQLNCRQKVEACIACERNSFLNPIRCYCDTDLRPVIGCRWGALLVAGNDTEKPVIAEALTKDINMLKKLITSLAPCIMGISEDKVRTVVPDRPGKSDKEQELLWLKVKDCINDFSKEEEVDTLLIYFSCHGAKERGQGDVNDKPYFKLRSVSDSTDSVSFTEFEKELEKLEKIDKLVIILDCCYPVFVQFKNRDRKYIQFNACKSDKKADIRDEGSIFTKYLIQGLKACSEEKRCSKSCKPCKDYWSERSDFISVKSLIEYVNSHMNKGPEEGLITRADWSNLAFYTDEKVVIDFTCGQQKETVSLEYLQEMEKLEEKLFEVFGKDKNQFKIRIQKDTYRTEDRLQDCDTLEKVMSAWVHRQPLKVVFDSDSRRENDMETDIETQILYSRHGV